MLKMILVIDKKKIFFIIWKLDIYFEIDIDFFGEIRKFELIADGSNIPVTNLNRQSNYYLLNNNIKNFRICWFICKIYFWWFYFQFV